MDCAKLADCPFYNDKMSMDKGIRTLYKKKYCNGNHQHCARYQVLEEMGAAYVPDHLYPNMLDVARKIIDEAKALHANS